MDGVAINNISVDEKPETSNHYGTRRKPRRPYNELLSPKAPETKPSVASPSTNILVRKRKLLHRNGTSKGNTKTTSIAAQRKFRSIEENGRQCPVYLLDQTTELKANECIYLVSEPPSEPYYIGRIMEFARSHHESVEFDTVRVNWFYRPRDMQHHNNDSRLLFATMHSDLLPLSSIRGKCVVSHKSQISDMDAFRKQPDSFYYDRLFDKFMRRQYEVIPVDAVNNVPEHVKEVLLQRWKYVVVEINRAKELAMEHRACRQCGDWCASKDSVRCAICHSDFHMHCVDPPLPRKPTRGFVWSCTPCSRAEAKRMDLAHVPDHDMSVIDEPDGSFVSSHQTPDSGLHICKDAASQTPRRATSSDLNFSSSASVAEPQQIAHPELWPFRYLGIHCNINDAADYDDRIYPRAASRIGQRYQATVQDWPGRPIQYFEKTRRPIKRTPKAMKGKKTDERASIESTLISNETTRSKMKLGDHHRGAPGPLFMDSSETFIQDTMATADRPPWLQEKPLGYIPRGDRATSECLWKPFEGATLEQETNVILQDYFKLLEPIAQGLKVDWRTPNFLDLAIRTLFEHNYSTTSAVHNLKQITRESIAEPTFSKEEVLRFEESVKKNGSELAQVAEDVGSQTVASCVRFYYIWKKTPEGSRIWASSVARKPKAVTSTVSKSPRTSVSDQEQIGDSSDDSAYSIENVSGLSRTLRCKFCDTKNSDQWYRAPGAPLKKNNVLALCERCANLWRKYAVTWERPEDVFKKLHEGNYRGKRRRLEEELLKELPLDGSRPGRFTEDNAENSKNTKKIKKLEKSKMTAQVSPELILLCAICRSQDANVYYTCAGCGLHVHRLCYGISGGTNLSTAEWFCDPCQNDIVPQASTDYKCVLCYAKPDISTGCVGALKRTMGNNWAHISCATWHPGVTFANADTLAPILGISAIPLTQWLAICEICKMSHGACITCGTCDRTVHVECALRADYTLGFSLLQIKSSHSRRDNIATVRIGAESGLLETLLYCPDHSTDAKEIRAIGGVVPPGDESTLTTYVKTYKLTNDLVGTTRRSRGGRVRDFRDISPEFLQRKNQILKGHTLDHDTSQTEEESSLRHYCYRCQVQFSPCFYPMSQAQNESSEPAPAEELCHRCYYLGAASKEPLLVNNG